VTELSDGAVVRQVLAGDVEAFRLLVARHQERLGRFAMRMLGHREEAEEALQDAFVRAYRSLSQCRDPERFEAWLFHILANRCRTRGTRRSRHEATFVADQGAAEPVADVSATDRMAWGEEIDRALARLEPDAREAFLLRHVEDMSYEEMAALTGAGISALKMRVKRACERLRRLLQEAEYV
jgi:RNA polymerase sigma-70 factor (ECF subfamily)